tara:strand:- start:279 stop:758 length:480 start_codon:yes stop_codon:yes gene_type:complete
MKPAALLTGALAGMSLVLTQTEMSEYSIYTAVGAGFTFLSYLYLRNKAKIIDAVDDGIEDLTGLDLSKEDVEKLVDQAADSIGDIASDALAAAEEGKDIAEAITDAIEDEIEEEIGIVIDLSELTVKGLKKELKQLGLSTKGKKAELVARLTDAMSEDE